MSLVKYGLDFFGETECACNTCEKSFENIFEKGFNVSFKNEPTHSKIAGINRCDAEFSCKHTYESAKTSLT